VGVAFGDQLSVLDRCLVLFRDGDFNGVIAFSSSRNRNVHFRRLGRKDFGVEGFLSEVELASRGFVDGDRRNGSQNLHFDRGTVNDISGRNEVLEDDRALGARINDDGVDLSLDLDGGSHALIDVASLLGFGIINNDASVINLVFDSPFGGFEGELWRLGNFGFSVLARCCLLWFDCGDDATSFVGVSVLGLHIRGNFLQSLGDISSLVELGE